MREALKILGAEGQVVCAPHRGYRVAQLSLADLLEVCRLRELFEGEAARVAVERAGDDVRRAMEQAAREVEAASDAGDLAAMADANRRFHFLLITAAGMLRSVFVLVMKPLPMLVGGGPIVLGVLIHLATGRRRARRTESEAGTTSQAPADAR